MAKKASEKLNTQTASAILRYLRISSRKVRLVANIVKKLPVKEAEAQLMLNSRRPSETILKLLRSAIANAKAKKMDESKLFISDIRVNQGPILKRWIPRAQGRATPIHKNTSHLEIVLQEGEKLAQPRFITEIKKVKKSKKQSEHTHEHKSEKDHQHEHEHLVAEQHKQEGLKNEEKIKQIKTEKQEIKKDKNVSDKGFVQKIFRRKSI